MIRVGFDQPLYFLPFDHCGFLQAKMFGWNGTLAPPHTEHRSPTPSRCSVPYNPGGDKALNQRPGGPPQPPAAMPGFIGFALGRTRFWNPLLRWLQREVANSVGLIANRYQEFVSIFKERAYAA